MAKYTKAETKDAQDQLRAILKPGDTIKMYIRSVSRSGMSRTIVPFVIDSDGDTRHIGWLVCKAIDAPSDKDQGVKMGGCGMDMGFAMAYSLGHALWPGGFGCVGEKCRSADHSNGDRDRTPHACAVVGGLHTHGDSGTLSGPKVGPECHWHASGGYALRHDWI